jgi:hypothetical protein
VERALDHLWKRRPGLLEGGISAGHVRPQCGRIALVQSLAEPSRTQIRSGGLHDLAQGWPVHLCRNVRKEYNCRKCSVERAERHVHQTGTSCDWTSGDQFCVYVADRLVLPELPSEDITAIATGLHQMDVLVCRYIHENLSYRFLMVPNGSAASLVEKTIIRGG